MPIKSSQYEMLRPSNRKGKLMMELKDHIIQKLLDDIREKTLETAV